MQALALVLGVMVLVGATLRVISWMRRRRLTVDLPEGEIVRQQRGISMRVLTQGPPVFPGMSTSKANRTWGDLILMNDRMLLVCNRGKLLDIGQEHGRKLTSARCTGPGRLVLEGELPVPAGVTGRYRIELATEDAQGWAAALSVYVNQDAQTVSWAG